MRFAVARVLELRQLAGGYFYLCLEESAPAEPPRPGQFFMLGRPQGELASDPLLNRPISAMGTRAGSKVIPPGIEFLVKEAGRGTRLLSALRPDDRLGLFGPGGSAFPPPAEGERLCLVGGGVGIAPMLFCARAFAGVARTTMFYGGRSAADLPALDDCRRIPGLELFPVTEDGSCGEKGLVTHPLAKFLHRNRVDRLYTCGPTPMMKAVWALAGKEVPLWAALENRMACGMGVCMGCVVPIQGDGGLSMQRVCHEGPVFPGDKIIWDRLP